MADSTKLFNWALKAAALMLGFRPQSQQQVRTLDQKDVALINLKQKPGASIVVFGARDTGKTELCYRLAEFLNKPTYAVSPQQKPPSWITWIREPDDIFSTLPPDSTLLMDDIPAYMSNKDYAESFSRSMEKVIPMVRHDPQPPEFPIGRCHLIFSSQSSAQADRYILDCDMAFLKPLGLLLQDIERPTLAKIYRTMVDPEFEGQDEFFIKTHAFMLSRTYKGLITFKKVS